MELDVLLVEDDALILDSLAEVLGDAGFSTVRSASAEEALRLLDGEAPEVLVTDINLGPGMDGLALGREVRARHPEIAVVYISGRYPGVAGLSARERFMAKPFGAAEFVRTIREAKADGQA